MTDTAASPAPATPAKGPKGRQAKPKRLKVAASHPKYVEMTVSAIGALKERNGSSRQAILKYIMGHFSVGKDPKVVNTHLKMALKRGVSSGVLKHSKGQGASGSFRVSGEKNVAAKKKPAKTKRAAAAPAATPEKKAAKVVAKKAKKPKAKAAEKKKAKSPKKEKKPKTPKKSVEKKKKAAVKPKKPKTPKKSTEKKAPKAKKAAKPKSPKAKRGRK